MIFQVDQVVDVAEKTDGKIKYIAERPGSYSLAAPLLRQGKDEVAVRSSRGTQ